MTGAFFGFMSDVFFVFMPAPIRKQTRNMHLVALHNSTNDTSLPLPDCPLCRTHCSPSPSSYPRFSACMLSLRMQQQAFLIML